MPHILALLFGLLLSTILIVAASPAHAYVAASGDEITEVCGDCDDSCPAETPGGECNDGCAFCGCGASVHVFVASFLELPDIPVELIETHTIDGPEQARASGVPPGIFKPPRTLI